MLDEAQLEERERILALAQRAIVANSPSGPDEEAERRLLDFKAPLNLLFVGETNSGKSSLINSLAEEPVAEAGPLPTTQQLTLYGRDQELPPEVSASQMRVMTPLTQVFALIDTPGLSKMSDAQGASLQHLVGSAAAIFAVFEVENPWAAATWDFLQSLPGSFGGQLLIVLQRADSKTAKQLRVIKDHLRELSEQKLGRALPIFPVSRVLEGELPIFRQGGLEELEQFLSKAVLEGELENQRKSRLLEAISGELSKASALIDAQASQVREDLALLNRIKSDIGAAAVETVSEAEPVIKKLAALFAAQGRKLKVFLQGELGLKRTLRSLFVNDDLADEVERRLINQLTEAALEAAKANAVEIQQKCQDHWSDTSRLVSERLKLELEGEGLKAPELGKVSIKFAQEVASAARQSGGRLLLKTYLEKEISRRRAELRGGVMFILGLLMGAGLLGGLGLGGWSWGFLVLAVVLSTIYFIRARSSAFEVGQSFLDKIERCREPFAEHVRQNYENEVRAFFDHYQEVFTNLREVIAQRKEALAPRQVRRDEDYLELKRLENLQKPSPRL